MFRYVKVKPSDPQIVNLSYTNWFLVLEPNQDEPYDLSQTMQEKNLRSVCRLHEKPSARDEADEIQRWKMAATRKINYEELANKYGTLLIRPSGSYMLLSGNDIIEEQFNDHFPVDEFADIVICENDKSSESKWVTYLKKAYPEKSIATINFFDLRDEKEIQEYFDKAAIISFSTTFSNFEWFEKLTRLAKPHHQIIGYSHNPEKWEKALTINDKVEIVEEI